MDSVNEIYQRQVKALPVIDRLQLVRLIMDELAESAPSWVVELSDAWSEEDLRDVTRSALLYAEHTFGDEDASTW